MYTVLARKWRPQVFEDLVGQQNVTRTLENAIKEGRIHHAFLFAGPRGVGKTTCARILAKALNCHSSSGPVIRPCGECPSCQDISASRSMDVLEIDGASNRGIDEVRELRDSAKYQAIRDRYRIFIIDEVHMLTTEAFNALLKILEEPPAHVFFMFATTEKHKVPATIASRCQVFDFKRISDNVLMQRLSHITREEKIAISDRSLEMIASASEGGLRDALGLLDQVVAFSGMKVKEDEVESVLGLVNFDAMIELGQAIAKGDSSAVLMMLDRIAEYGIDYKEFYKELLHFYRDLFLIRFSGEAAKTVNVDERMIKLASSYDEIHLLRICHQLVSVQNLLRMSGNLRFLFEVTLVKLCQIQHLVPLDELTDVLKKNSSQQPSIARAVSAKISSVIASPAVERTVVQPKNAVSTTTTTSQPLIADDFFAMFISDLEQQNPRLAAALEDASFSRNGSKVTFYVPDTFFIIVKVDSRVYNDLQTLLEKKLGGPIEVEIVKGQPSENQDAVKISTPETLVENDPTVKEFVKAFKGKISKIELNKERFQ
jgi:DNA polymerase III subunit gamma/tau